MKQAFCLAALFAASLSAQAYQITPWGTWPLCPIMEWACDPLSLHQFSYLLNVDTASFGPEVTAFSYVITATINGNPEPVTFSGSFDRNDKMYGWSSVVFDAGGRMVVRDVVITAEPSFRAISAMPTRFAPHK